MTATGVLICGHGGREAGTVREFMALSRDVAARLPQFRIETGFLEFSTPAIPDGLEKLRQAGCRSILVIPGTLFSGGHASRDIPAIIQNFSGQAPDVQIRYGRAFDADANLADAACARVLDAINAAAGSAGLSETGLLVAGRGASDSSVLASMETAVRMIQERLKIPHVRIAYAGLAAPAVPEALGPMAALGCKQVVILPYFLFSGMLVTRIYDQTNIVAAQHPGIRFIKAGYLNNHPGVIKAFVAQILETQKTGTVQHGRSAGV